ncbi:MAG: alkaline phosphatase family protein, partial [Haloechinothrix sp.]
MNVDGQPRKQGFRSHDEIAESRGGGLDRRHFLGVAAGVAGLAVIGQAPAAAATAEPARAASTSSSADRKRVVVIVVDGLNRDVVQRYGMSHIAGLMKDGVNFRNSYLGHMGALTVVTHNVITSGQLPKNMGWADEGFRDVDGVLRPLSTEPANPYWVTSGFSAEQMFALMEHAGYPKLSDYLHAAFPGTAVAVVSPKTYAGYAFGGPTADIVVTFSGRNFDCDGDGERNWRGPAGVNPPGYLTEPGCGRFYDDSAKDLTYDTHLSPARM